MENMINNLNGDLTREYAHLHFYLNASIRVRGVNRPELSKFFLDAARGEVEHIIAFGRLITGLGGVPTTDVAPFVADLTTPDDLIREAIAMEEAVVSNYLERMNQCDQSGDVNGAFVHAFIEQQLVDSRSDVDELKQMLDK
jgi:bacterioferritin (cytochrome b1)